MELDWCFNAASIGLKDERKLAFAYIFIQYARKVNLSLEEDSYPKGFRYLIPRSVIDKFDIEFYNKKKWKASYLTFLKVLIKKYLLERTSLGVLGIKLIVNKDLGVLVKVRTVPILGLL